MIQGGDFTKFNGRGGESIYGGKFEDEDLTLKHSRAGLLAMANAGKDTNGSQFFITCSSASHLDGYNVVFGEIVTGMELLRLIEKEPVDPNSYKPDCVIKIVDCGQIDPDNLIVLKEKILSSNHSSDSEKIVDKKSKDYHPDKKTIDSENSRIDSKGRKIKGRGSIGIGGNRNNLKTKETIDKSRERDEERKHERRSERRSERRHERRYERNDDKREYRREDRNDNKNYNSGKETREKRNEIKRDEIKSSGEISEDETKDRVENNNSQIKEKV